MRVQNENSTNDLFSHFSTFASNFRVFDAMTRKIRRAPTFATKSFFGAFLNGFRVSTLFKGGHVRKKCRIRTYLVGLPNKQLMNDGDSSPPSSSSFSFFFFFFYLGRACGLSPEAGVQQGELKASKSSTMKQDSKDFAGAWSRLVQWSIAKDFAGQLRRPPKEPCSGPCANSWWQLKIWGAHLWAPPLPPSAGPRCGCAAPLTTQVTHPSSRSTQLCWQVPKPLYGWERVCLQRSSSLILQLCAHFLSVHMFVCKHCPLFPPTGLLGLYTN